MALTTAQRIAIRAIHDGDAAGVLNRTKASLRRRGYLDQDNQLTHQGQTVHKQIMAGGDGPEDLKAMFRFRF